MKIIKLLFIFIIGILLLAGCKTDNKSDNRNIRLITEENPPFNFVENGQITGVSVDIVKAIQKELGITQEIEVMKWGKGYELLQNQPNIALFTTTLNENRKDKFKWVGPLSKIEYSFYAKKNADFDINSIDDAKKISKIATIKDYAIEEQLNNLNFSNLVSSENEIESIKKLLNNEVDLMTRNNIAMESLLKKINEKPDAVKKVFTFSTNLMYIAFSKSTPDEIINQWQNALDKLKQNGKFDQIYEKYFSVLKGPGIVQLVTENYPPISFSNNGEADGYAVDIVKEISKRLGYTNKEIHVMSWNSAYNLALLNPNIVLFSTTKTEKREDLFEWLGPIGSYYDKIYVKKDKNIVVNNIDDIKKLNEIGTVNGWFSQEYLESKNFDNLVKVDNPEDMVKLLLTDKVGACAFTDMTAPEIFKNADYDFDSVKPVYTIKKYDFYITFSKGTNPEIIELWSETFENMKQDKTLKKFKNKWLP